MKKIIEVKEDILDILNNRELPKKLVKEIKQIYYDLEDILNEKDLHASNVIRDSRAELFKLIYSNYNKKCKIQSADIEGIFKKFSKKINDEQKNKLMEKIKQYIFKLIYSNYNKKCKIQSADIEDIFKKFGKKINDEQENELIEKIRQHINKKDLNKKTSKNIVQDIESKLKKVENRAISKAIDSSKVSETDEWIDKLKDFISKKVETELERIMIILEEDDNNILNEIELKFNKNKKEKKSKPNKNLIDKYKVKVDTEKKITKVISEYLKGSREENREIKENIIE